VVSRHRDPLGTRRVVYGVLSWIALGIAWWAVLHRDHRTWLPQLVVPTASLVVVTVLTLLWVRHNLGIYQRKGPRQGVPEVDDPWVSDSLGRRLDLPADVAGARHVRVVLDGDVKRYEVLA
jgi:hypothetical protein